MSITDQAWLLFTVTPLLVVAVAYVAVRLHQRSLDRNHPRHPAE